MTHRTRTTTSPVEALIVCTICFGWAIVASTLAMISSSHGGAGSATFSDQTFQGTIFWEVLFAATAITFLYMRGFAINTLYPAPTATGFLIGIALFVANLVAYECLFYPFTQQIATQPITAMVAQAHFTAPWLVAGAIVNGAFEEIFLLGFLARGLRKHGQAVAIGISLLVRILYHSYQGPFGMLAVLAFGLVLSVYFAATNKLYPVVFAHIIADIVPFAH